MQLINAKRGSDLRRSVKSSAVLHADQYWTERKRERSRDLPSIIYRNRDVIILRRFRDYELRAYIHSSTPADL